MEDGDIVEVHMEQIGGGLSREEIEDWVEIESTKTQLKNVTEEKARLMATTNRLRLELTALKINNRALARENNSLKVSLEFTGLVVDADFTDRRPEERGEGCRG